MVDVGKGGFQEQGYEADLDQGKTAIGSRMFKDTFMGIENKTSKIRRLKDIDKSYFVPLGSELSSL